jgi:very-short-patch-repair endonuclease
VTIEAGSYNPRPPRGEGWREWRGEGWDESDGCIVLSDCGSKPGQVRCTHCRDHMFCWCSQVSAREYNRRMLFARRPRAEPNVPFSPWMPPATSPIEAQFWDAYRAIKPRELRGLVSQCPVGRYRVDFGLPKLKIGIELDGFKSHSSTQAIADDRRRERDLMMAGWYIIRFGGQEVYYDPAGCVRQAAMLAGKIARMKARR